MDKTSTEQGDKFSSKLKGRGLRKTK